MIAFASCDSVSHSANAKRFRLHSLAQLLQPLETTSEVHRSLGGRWKESLGFLPRRPKSAPRIRGGAGLALLERRILVVSSDGYGSKLNHHGTAGFSPWFHSPRATPRHATLITPRHATPGQARPGQATLRHATPRHATPRLAHPRARARPHARRHAGTNARTHARTDAETRARTDTRTDTQTHRHTDTQTRRHTDTQTHRHTDTQTHSTFTDKPIQQSTKTAQAHAAQRACTFSVSARNGAAAKGQGPLYPMNPVASQSRA